MDQRHANTNDALLEFWAECEELSERISKTLSQFETNSAANDAIDSLYRDIHTLKGSAYLFGFHQIGNVAHAMETSLENTRQAHSQPNSELLELLFHGLDATDKLVDIERARLENRVSPESAESFIPQTVESYLNVIGGNMALERDTAPLPMDGGISSPPCAPEIPIPIENIRQTAPSEDLTERAPDNASATEISPNELSSTIRVSVALLDKLMTLMGEMVLVRNQVLQYSSRTDDLEFSNLSQRLDVVTSEIQGEMMKTRMQPIGNVLTKFQRLVRDLARDLNKKIQLQLSGTETELDKTLLEAVKDPLTHLVRNACDHAIETTDERVAASKPACGTITVRAFHEGGQVIIEIADDGRGLSQSKLLNRAVENGILSPEKAATLSEREAFNLIFLPGFSTAAKVTQISGRGVGMDVVKSNIEKIGGIVELESKTGRGTTIRLKIPLTLAIVPAMIVRCEGDRYAIPQVKLVELVRVDQNRSEPKIEYLQGKMVYRLRGNLLPLVNLKETLEFPKPEGQLTRPIPDIANIVVVRAERQMFGMIVDEIQDTADIVVKPLNRFLKGVTVYSGATLLGDGSVACILDTIGIAARIQLSGNNSTDATTDVEASSIEKPKVPNEFLLFRLNSPTKHAFSLGLVHRLEEFKRNEIEVSGGQRVMRYRGSILPIISLNEFLRYAPPQQTERDVIPVIVTQRQDRLYGIEVNEILDVMTTESRVDESVSDRPGIQGSLIAKDEVIVAVDTFAVLNSLANRNENFSATKSEPHHILYLEDNNLFRKHVRVILEEAGYRVTCAENGAEAMQKLSAARRGEYSIILSDIEMPVMDGLEFARSIRKNTIWSDIPMIALSSRFEPLDIQNGKTAGFNEYLQKINPTEVVDSLLRFLRRGEN